MKENRETWKPANLVVLTRKDFGEARMGGCRATWKIGVLGRRTVPSNGMF